ncbi:MAG: hypothetical protein AB7V22_04155 [Kiritimatiellia bacterium]
MKIDQVNSSLRRWAVGGASLLLAVVSAWGQGAVGVSVPLYAGNLVPLQDEFGRPMRGSPAEAAAAFRPRVEVRQAFLHPYYQVYTNLAPGLLGESSPYNPLVATNVQIGMGQNASAANAGLFCAVFPQRPTTGTRIFARAFNAPDPAEATFYADSAVVEVESNEATVVFTFGALRPLDSADDDGDGLANSWEQLLGTADRWTADYDGDGMSDLHEMLAGTAPDDPASKLAFRLVRSEASAQPLDVGAEPTRAVRVKWQSVPGKKYRLEYVPQLAAIDPATGEPYAFELVPGGDVEAGAGEYEIDLLVEVPADAATSIFRVKLVVE